MKPPGQRREEIPWTAARCNRLLRTITSRLSILRKLAKHATQPESACRYPSGDAASIFSHSVQPLRPILSDSLPVRSPRTRDPDWLPQNRKRQCDRTYAGNAKRRKVKVDGDRDIRSAHDFRTPFIKRVLVSNLAQSPIESPTSAVVERGSQNHRNEPKRRGLPILPATSADQASRTLLEAFEAILIATEPDTAPSRLGASSLLNTCLRKIPTYVDLEQSCAEGGHEAQGCDVTSDIYEYLESFGTRSGGGWSGLRSVVRAHAAALIQDAMNDGIFPRDPLESLLAICRRRGATKESQSILHSWFESQDDKNTTILDGFIARCVSFDHRSLLLRCCTDVVNRNPETFPFLSENPGLWCEVVKAFLSPSTRAIASSFCETFILASMHQDRSRESLGNVLRAAKIHDANVLLTALAWKQCGTESKSHIAQHLLRWPIVASLTDQTTDGASLIQPFLLSSLALTITKFQTVQDVQHPGDKEVLHLIARPHDPSKTVAAFTDFIISVGKILTHADSSAAEEFLRSGTAGLLEMARTCSRDLATISRAIATGTAKGWADYRDNNEGYSLLEEIEYAVWVSETCDPTTNPALASRPVSYRWEEGLCEWVEKTPNIRESVDAIPSDTSLGSVHDSGVDLEYDSPAQKNSTERKVDTAPEAFEEEDWDDEDELALVTPIQQRQKRVRVRFDLTWQDVDYAKKTSKLLQSGRGILHADEASDDELAYD